MQLNKRDAWLHNRSEQINNLISVHKPHLFVINELNLHPEDTVTCNAFPQYRLLTDNLAITDQYSRTGILIHESINYKRRPDLECQGISTIWIQTSHPGRKPILIQACYRQFQRIGVEGSLSIQEQRKRWGLLLAKWEIAAREEKEIITLGDMNLNKFSWNLHNTEKNQYEKLQTPMVKMLHDKILTQGFTVLNSQQTKEKNTPLEKSSCLDLIITNRKDKIVSHQTIGPTFSESYKINKGD